MMFAVAPLAGAVPLAAARPRSVPSQARPVAVRRSVIRSAIGPSSRDDGPKLTRKREPEEYVPLRR